MSNLLPGINQRRPFHSYSSHNVRPETDKEIISISDDDDRSDLDGFLAIEEDLPEIVDLEDSAEDADGHETLIDAAPDNLNSAKVQSRVRSSKVRNPPIELPWAKVDQVLLGNSSLRAGKAVQLRPATDGMKRPHFLTVRHILKNLETDEVRVSGLPVYRNCISLGMFPQKLNEVYMELDQDLDDPRDLYEQAMLEFDLDEVVKLRSIKFTHLEFPELTYRSHTFLSRVHMSAEIYEAQRKMIKDSCELVCRYIRINQHVNARSRRSRPNFALTDVRKLYHSEDPSKGTTPVLQQNEPRRPRTRLSRPEKRVKTYSDGFSGAGGSTLGAQTAGFKVSSTFDHDPKCGLTLELNFPHVLNFVQSANEMIAKHSDVIPPADVCHLSCPCQPWSQAHAKDLAPRDDDNVDALLIVEHFLSKTKPTITTLEQTSGLPKQKRHRAYFAALIDQYLRAGYNVRWKIVNFCDFGLPSTRERLIVFASLVGHPLPEMPGETHGPGREVPYVKWADVVNRVPANLDWHLDSDQAKPYPSPRTPTDPDKLMNCIVTGGTIVHPSGLRSITIRERAALNGFPPNFKFPALGEKANNEKISYGTIRKQIGNAVPPLVWKQFMAKVKECLDDFEDGKIDEAGNRITLGEVAVGVSTAANRMRGLSLEPTYARQSLKPNGAARDRSITLSPDPPMISTGSRALTPTPSGRRSVHPTDQLLAAPPRKKREFVDLCDECSSSGATPNKKKAKDCHTIDLTDGD